MNPKMKSAIEKITLNDATFSNEVIEPTYVNFFYGKNGAGKSTIARTFKANDERLQWQAGKASTDYDVLVYDTDFINANLRNYGNLAGVFTVNETNIAIQEQVDTLNAERKKMGEEYNGHKAAIDQKTADKNTALSTFQSDCWSKSAEARTLFDEAIKGKKKAALFAQEILAITPVAHDVEDLKTLYGTVFSGDAQQYNMGYKPVEDGFELKYGIFYRFCQKAANHPDKDYFFIIDEINRGNMSKIFGELLMLIEADYRDTKATLAYNGLSFSVPKRLHIIGMMNTADRSLAMIDYALRRRFSFFDMEPGFDSEGFIKYQEGFANDTFNTLIDRIKELNQEIAKDKSLGKGFCIGHSYFCNTDECTEEWMQDVVDFDVLPMLAEYWFDDTDKLQRWENILHGVFQ